MRSGIAGFFLGAFLALVALFALQRLLVSPVADEISYHFSTCVFGQAQFPQGDLDNGRLLRRALLPVCITVRFFDARDREVKEADQPGRYGAVVRIKTNGGPVVYRFITLYRTPGKIFWDKTPLLVTAKLPDGLGLDAAVLQNQSREIGETLANDSVDEDGHTTPALAVLLAGLAETSPADPPALKRTNAMARDAEWWDGLRQRIGLTEDYPRLVDLPRGYDTEPGQHWPLIFFFDHSGDQGNNLSWVRHSGLAGLIDRGKQLPAVVVSPQCPAGEAWSVPVLSRLLDEICAKYRIDPDRIYLTGISAGGDGAWAFALAHPERFAALVPICGESDPADAARLKDLPVWAFHGLRDDVVPPGQTIDMIEAIRRAGGHPHLTLFPQAGHDAWDQAYALDALYDWLLAQKRGSPEVPVPGLPH